MCIPYIYKVTFKLDGRVYIGSKSNKLNSNPEMFWKQGGYFTTSKVIKDMIKEYGTSDEFWSCEIVETFPAEMIKEVRRIENDYIIALVNEVGESNVINKKWVINGQIHSNTGIPHTEETCRLISEKAMGKVQAIDSQGNRVRISKEEFETGNYTGCNTGNSFYYNPITMERRQFSKGSLIPDGFVLGSGIKASDEQKKNISERRKGCVWINDGTINKTINKEDSIPEGWFKGRLKLVMPGWSEERRAKRKATMDKKTADRLANKIKEG